MRHLLLIPLTFAFFLCSCSPKYTVIDLSVTASTQPLAGIRNELQNAEMQLGDTRGYERFDYQDSTFVLITSGHKGGGGHRIEIRNFDEQPDKIYILAKDIPPKNTPTTAAQTNPKILLQIKKTDKKINLSWNY